MEEPEEKGKGTGKPASRRAALGTGRDRTTQEFFRHGNDDNSGDNIFSTSGRPVMRGALARSHSAVAISPQQVFFIYLFIHTRMRPI